jgi:hypothetical protein
VLVDRYPVQIPFDAAAPQILRADAGFFLDKAVDEPASGSGDTTGALNVLGSVRILPRVPAPVHPVHPAEANLGDAITLLGYDLAPAGAQKPGQDLKLTLYWQGAGPLSED